HMAYGRSRLATIERRGGGWTGCVPAGREPCKSLPILVGRGRLLLIGLSPEKCGQLTGGDSKRLSVTASPAHHQGAAPGAGSQHREVPRALDWHALLREARAQDAQPVRIGSIARCPESC